MAGKKFAPDVAAAIITAIEKVLKSEGFFSDVIDTGGEQSIADVGENIEETKVDQIAAASGKPIED